MTVVAAVLLAAAGFLIGWAAGSAVAARITRRFAQLARALAPTARPKFGEE
jgi:Flp pilus assembly protein TadB